MAVNQKKPSLLPDLNMPIRDALRGVFTLADATEDMLEPASLLLPEPLRARFRRAMLALEKASKRLINAPIDTAKITLCARFVTGSAPAQADVSVAASVIVYAWQHLNENSVEHRHLISETIVADRLSRLRQGADAITPGQAGARVFMDLRSSSAIGVLPGFARAISQSEEVEVDLALIAIAVWLVSKRAESLAEEEKLLDLSMALVRALQDDAAAAFDSPAALADFLDDTSSHL